jgi:glycine cleavage system P protein (glycine dehydrogenase) subunit 2
MVKKSIFDIGGDAKKSSYLDSQGVPDKDISLVIPKSMLREKLEFPNAGELEVVRHYCRLNDLSFSVDSNFYPLGSCTMKYNPKINEYAANLNGFCGIHPYQNEKDTQGALQVLYELQEVLCAITGMKRFTLQPSSGAQGELCGMLMIHHYYKDRGIKKTNVIVPDSAHGTNPATAAMCGYKILVVKSNSDGLIDLDSLKELVSDQTAAIMLTNPNTLGLFEENILEVSDIIHENGGMLYYDGANFNPLLGVVKPHLMGFDVMHLNIHKTFSTPHGCGGPGAGVVGVCEKLVEYLPVPIVSKNDNSFYFDYDCKHTIGRLRSFYGNFSVLLRAYAYILRLGRDGLRRVAHNSVLNANYIKESLKDYYEVPYPKTCMHEVVFSCSKQKERGVSALDISKRLIDYGIHPPTMYFPLIVKEALMVEPTETESKDTIDNFIKILKKIDKETVDNPQIVKDSPQAALVMRVDEVRAARNLEVKWKKDGA